MLQIARESSSTPVAFDTIVPEDFQDNVALFVDETREAIELGGGVSSDGLLVSPIGNADLVATLGGGAGTDGNALASSFAFDPDLDPGQLNAFLDTTNLDDEAKGQISRALEQLQNGTLQPLSEAGDIIEATDVISPENTAEFIEAAVAGADAGTDADAGAYAGADDAIYADNAATDQLFAAGVNTQFTREQLEQGLTPGINDFAGPAELSPDIIEAVIANGQVASNGFIVVEDEVFADEANIGEAGVFQDIVGNVRVLGVAPGTSDRELREIVTSEIERLEEGPEEGQPDVVVSDLNDLVRAFSGFQNGNTRPVELVEEGGIPNPADLAAETVGRRCAHRCRGLQGQSGLDLRVRRRRKRRTGPPACRRTWCAHRQWLRGRRR